MITEKRLTQIISESINMVITESFASSKIREFFNMHGGLNKEYRNFLAGDISDDEICFFEEYDSIKDARNDEFKMGRKRNDLHFYTLIANDGKAAVIGIYGEPADFKMATDKEYPKKMADRLNRNGWNFKTRDNRYVDDSDAYYYGGGKKRSTASDFGMYTNKDYKNKLSSLSQSQEKMPKDAYDKWRNKEYRHMKDYLKRNYGR